jgi:hypothetical protein
MISAQQQIQWKIAALSLILILSSSSSRWVRSQDFPREPPLTGDNSDIYDGSSNNNNSEEKESTTAPPIDLPQEDDSTCSVCIDGSEPVSSDTPFTNTATTSLTCNDLIATASTVTEGSKACEEIQLAGFQGNCCEDTSYLVTPESFDRCALCPNGGTFLPFKEIPTKSGTAVMCSDLTTNTDIIAEFLRNYIESPGDCEDTALRRSAAWCGCAGTTIECELSCGGGNPIDVEQTHPLTGMSCQEIIFQFASLTNEQCPNVGMYLQFDPVALCCPSSDIESDSDSSLISCPLCANTQVFASNKIVISEEFGEVTCGDAQSAANLLLSDQACTDHRQTFSQSCCFASPADDELVPRCELKCPTTGETPTDLSREDPGMGYSCNDLLVEYSNLTAEQCSNASSIIGFDAVSFCCDNIEDDEPSEPTSPPVNVPEDRYDCRICPPQQRLLYPSRVLFAYNELTCSEVEETASSIFEELVCFSLLDESRALSNCVCRSEQDGGVEEVENGETVVEIIGSGSTRPNLWDVKGWNVKAAALLFVLFYVML